jgi:hypothetical protein
MHRTIVEWKHRLKYPMQPHEIKKLFEDLKEMVEREAYWKEIALICEANHTDHYIED